MNDLEVWNPRFVLFSREQGFGPQEWIDSHRDSGGVVTMLPFTLWISDRWDEYRAHLKKLPTAERTTFDMNDQRRFDAWLSKRCTS